MTRPPPDWSLIREITRLVHSAPCGGVHRAELAAYFHLPAHGECMRDALIIAYRTKRVDFVRQYVVRPPR